MQPNNKYREMLATELFCDNFTVASNALDVAKRATSTTRGDGACELLAGH